MKVHLRKCARVQLHHWRQTAAALRRERSCPPETSDLLQKSSPIHSCGLLLIFSVVSELSASTSQAAVALTTSLRYEPSSCLLYLLVSDLSDPCYPRVFDCYRLLTARFGDNHPG
jgi:hypothetical protein